MSSLPPSLECSRAARCPSGALLPGGLPQLVCPGSGLQEAMELGRVGGGGARAYRRGRQGLLVSCWGRGPGAGRTVCPEGSTAGWPEPPGSPSPLPSRQSVGPVGPPLKEEQLCGCRPRTTGGPVSLPLRKLHQRPRHHASMLEVGPKGFASVLLTYATVWGIWEFIMGEVFINKKGALAVELGGCF